MHAMRLEPARKFSERSGGGGQPDFGNQPYSCDRHAAVMYDGGGEAETRDSLPCRKSGILRCLRATILTHSPHPSLLRELGGAPPSRRRCPPCRPPRAPLQTAV